MQLNDSIIGLPKIGPTTAQKLAQLGIFTIRDLLYHIPTRYIDYSHITPILQLMPNREATVVGTIGAIKSRRARNRRLSIQSTLITDDTGSIEVIWFNQPYLAQSLEEGSVIRLSGTPKLNNLHLQITAPTIEKASSDNLHTGRIVPCYALTANLTQRQLREWINYALKHVQITEDLPRKILQKEKLAPLADALRKLHFPDDLADAEQGRSRIAFEEMLVVQLYNTQQRSLRRSQKAYGIPTDDGLLQEFVRTLPFELTPHQKRAAWEVVQDLARKEPMNRLLEGDVGSGKTVVAAMAILQTVYQTKLQSALLAPTEILAWQHYQSLATLLAPFKINIALLTASRALLINQREITRKALIAKIRRGTVQLVIGTQAVLQKKIHFKKLGMVIVDEQHRFGVQQRHLLLQHDAATVPHYLSMTATPIPRSLALTTYGDLDLSLIRQLPKNRKPIKTKVVAPAKRRAAYRFLNDEIENGHQIFVIYPLIEDSEKLRAKAATKEFARLSKDVFPHRRLGLLHGRLHHEEKQHIMGQFQRGELDILVATSVVEVGIDIPNATVMMIENAERFGLAQLHQLRGRVGRGTHQSYCFLFADSNSEKTIARLSALEESNDGIVLAERDLALRGPGEMWGTMQSGFVDFKAAKLTDLDLIAATQRWAQLILGDGPKKYPALWNQLRQFRSRVHPE